MAKEVSWTLGMYMLAIIVGVLLMVWLFSPTGSFPRLRDTMKSITDSVSVGASEIKAETPTISEKHQEELSILEKTLRSMAASTKENCFRYYDGFSALGEKGLSIKIEYNAPDDKTYVQVSNFNGRQILTDKGFSIEHIRPCVIAGNEMITSNFDQQFLNGHLNGQDRNIPVQYTDLTRKGLIIQENSGVNKIDYGTGFYYFAGHQWLFKLDKEHICFFPTAIGEEHCKTGAVGKGLEGDVDPTICVRSCKGSAEEGLDDTCFDPKVEQGIPYQIEHGTLETC